jgi:hypothetical protein
MLVVPFVMNAVDGMDSEAWRQAFAPGIVAAAGSFLQERTLGRCPTSNGLSHRMNGLYWGSLLLPGHRRLPIGDSLLTRIASFFILIDGS